MTSPAPSTFRLPTETLRQLDQLAQVYGSNRTDAMIRAIERQWRMEQDELLARMVAGDEQAKTILEAQIVRYLQDHPNA